MNNIAKILANITISHKQLELSLHCRPVETLCNDSMTHRPTAYVGIAHASIDLLNYPFRFVGGGGGGGTSPV